MKRKALLASSLLATSSVFAAQEQELVLVDVVDYENQVVKEAHQKKRTADFAFSNQPYSLSNAEETGLVTIDVAVYFSPLYRESLSYSETVKRIEGYFERVNRAVLESGAYIEYHPVIIDEIAEDFSFYCNEFGQTCTEESENVYNLFEYTALGKMGWITNAISNPDGFNGYEEFNKYADRSIAYGADLHAWFQPGEFDEMVKGPLGLAAFLGNTISVADLTVYDQEEIGEKFKRDFDVLKNHSVPNTLMHELGHNLGLNHEVADYEDGGYSGDYADSFASTCGFGDIPGNGTSALYSRSSQHFTPYMLYTNPDIMREGVVCGDIEVANQARVVNDYASTVANLRERQVVADTIGFTSSNYEITQGAESSSITLSRDGDTSGSAEMSVVTFNGTAVEGEDFELAERVIRFSPGESEVSLPINVLTDNVQGKGFSLKLLRPLASNIGNSKAHVEFAGVGGLYTGSIEPSRNEVSFSEAQEQTITLMRTGDLNSEAVIEVTTTPGTAVENVHYKPVNEVVRIPPGQDSASFIVRSGRVAETETFSIKLEPVGGATVNTDVINATVHKGDHGFVTFAKPDNLKYEFNGREVEDRCEFHSTVDPESYSIQHDVCGFPILKEPNAQEFTLTLERKDGSSGSISGTVDVIELAYARDSSFLGGVGEPVYYVPIGLSFEQMPDYEPSENSSDVAPEYIDVEYFEQPSAEYYFAHGQTETTVTFSIPEMPNAERVDEYGFNFIAAIRTPIERKSLYFTNPGAVTVWVDDWSPEDTSGGGGEGGDDTGGGDNSGSDGGADDNSGSSDPTPDTGASTSGSSGGSTNGLILIALGALAWIRKILA